ncbi:LOW QUALITY PROTEIN: uncharacterized protein [Macrobrachium rosenbergii]|uniref:LOW QUALITY PROTEIN: uncharacterized protein n=1 Tax=Macrobrachium rosenbergii TaxID=79674 RepID=UPI0034D54050
MQRLWHYHSPVSPTSFNMAPKLWHLCILWVSTVSILAVELDPCEPDCTSASPFDKVEDPYDCTQFYYCLADHTPTDHSVACPAGAAFNPDDGDCTGAVPSTPVGGGGGGGCHLTCNGTGDVISDPFNCNIFYECDAAGPQPPRTCPADRPYFDGENCVNDEAVCCIPSCEPSCEAAATQVPDPKDCNKFYICTEPGTPDESLHFSCPSGQTFDIGTGHCSASAECKILCPGSTVKPSESKWSFRELNLFQRLHRQLNLYRSWSFCQMQHLRAGILFCKASGDAGEQKSARKERCLILSLNSLAVSYQEIVLILLKKKIIKKNKKRQFYKKDNGGGYLLISAISVCARFRLSPRDGILKGCSLQARPVSTEIDLKSIMEVFQEFRRCFVILVVMSSIVSGHDIRKPLTESGNVLSGKLGASLKKGVIADCLDTITCGDARSVAKCTNCDPRYFYCAFSGATPEEKTCPSGQLFNPDPNFPRCILSSNCPYHPYPVPSTTKGPDPTSLTTKGSCVDTVTCTKKSLVAKCTYCDPRYFSCSAAGATPVPKTCPSGQMFNPDPRYARCILTNNCPYHPPWSSTTTTSTSTTTTTTTSTTTTTTPSTTTTSTTTTPSTTISTTTTPSTTTSTTTTPSTTTSTTTTPSTTTSATTTPSTTTTSTTTTPSTTATSTATTPSTTTTPTTTTPSMTTTPTSTIPSTTTTPTTTSPSTTTTPTTTTPSTTTTPATTTSTTTTPTTTEPPTTTTSTTIPTATSLSSAETTTPKCRDTFNCSDNGNFTKCDYCYKEYFYCEKAGDEGGIKQCQAGYVFNTDPTWAKCVSAGTCPYHPEPPVPHALWSIFPHALWSIF